MTGPRYLMMAKQSATPSAACSCWERLPISLPPAEALHLQQETLVPDPEASTGPTPPSSPTFRFYLPTPIFRCPHLTRRNTRGSVRFPHSVSHPHARPHLVISFLFLMEPWTSSRPRTVPPRPLPAQIGAMASHRLLSHRIDFCVPAIL